MTHDPSYVDILPTADQVKREFVAGKGNGSHLSLLCLLRSGLTMAQVERYVHEEVCDHYLKLKANYIELWDKVCIEYSVYHICVYMYHCLLGAATGSPYIVFIWTSGV